MIVHLPVAGVYCLKQLVHLFRSHLLAEVRQDILELANADEACHILVENLKTAAILFGLAGVTEAAWPVQDALEGLEINCREYSS